MRKKLINQYKMDEQLKKALIIGLTEGYFGFDTFFLKDDTHVKMQFPFIHIFGKSKGLKRASTFVRDFGVNNHKDWIIIEFDTQSKVYDYVPLTEKAVNLLTMLKKIKHLTPLFQFEKTALFDSILNISVDSEIFIGIETGKETYCVITTEHGVDEFNLKHEQDLSILSNTKDKLLEIAKDYDTEAHFSNLKRTIVICNQQFAFSVKKTDFGWKIAFYKRYNSQYIFDVECLNEFQDDLCELTHKFAREEQLVDLFR